MLLFMIFYTTTASLLILRLLDASGSENAILVTIIVVSVGWVGRWRGQAETNQRWRRALREGVQQGVNNYRTRQGYTPPNA